MRTRVHISLSVKDLASSTRFYETLFDTPASKTKPDYTSFRLDSPALHLALVSSPALAGGHGGPSHFGLELFEPKALASWRSRIQKAGLPHTIEEGVTCCYAVAEKVWATDPEGNRWEFWVRQDEAETMGEETTQCCETSCCS